MNLDEIINLTGNADYMKGVNDAIQIIQKHIDKNSTPKQLFKNFVSENNDVYYIRASDIDKRLTFKELAVKYGLPEIELAEYENKVVGRLKPKNYLKTKIVPIFQLRKNYKVWDSYWDDKMSWDEFIAWNNDQLSELHENNSFYDDNEKITTDIITSIDDLKIVMKNRDFYTHW